MKERGNLFGLPFGGEGSKDSEAINDIREQIKDLHHEMKELGQNN